jgi:hypothetical protein
MPAVFFASALAVGLVMSGTGLLFSCLAFVFVVIATLASNIGGGVTRPSGSYVFFFATQAVIIGLCVKVVLWEPVELYLLSPVTTMAMYTGGVLAMLGAVYLSRRFSRDEGFLQDICTTKDLRLGATGCVIFGIVVPTIAEIIMETSTNPVLLALATASNQLNKFLPFGIILGVTYEIKSSGGKRSTNLWVWFAGIAIWVHSFILGFSKEGLFLPPACWLIAAAALRYQFRKTQVIAFALFIFVSLHYFVPYCQYGRNFRGDGDTLSEQIKISAGLLSNLEDVREKDLENNEAIDRQTSIFAFFSKPMGLFERLQMIGIDDKLVTVTDDKGPYGLSPIVFYLASLIPKFIWKNKPFIIMGNTFSHEIGYASDDLTTGISFSPVVEGYHEAKWFGVFVVCPLVWFAAFMILDSLCGDVRKSPWGLLAIAQIAHIAPEGLLQGLFYTMTYGALIVFVAAMAAAYLLPMLAHFVSPPKKVFRPVEVKAPGARPAFINGRPAPTQL